jgi:hypothetical protein
MMKLMARLADQALAAIVCAAALWLVRNPLGASDYVRRITSWFGAVDRAWSVGTVGAGIVLAAIGVTVGIFRGNSGDPGFHWEYDFGLPSIVTILIGSAAVCWLVAWALTMCSAGNTWGLLPLLLSGWISLRFAHRIRAAWARFAY